MTQPFKAYPNSISLETVACKKYMSRFLQRENVSVPSSKPRSATFGAEKLKQSPITLLPNQNQLTKIKPNMKQQNLPCSNSNQSPASNDFQYTDDSALVQVTVKTTNPRQRSRSTVANREPWGQLLRQHKSSDKVSVFSSFDPLRTLHFLAKEFQFQLQAVLPDDNTLQQMVTDMQNALKRVPPEIASIIHLQQAIDLLPTRKSSGSLHDEKPEKLKINLAEKAVQTLATTEQEECEKLQKIMEDSTIKLEMSCKQMEGLCEQLRKEKNNLEEQLKREENNTTFLKKKIEDLTFENANILNPKIKKLEEEKQKLESNLDDLNLKMETQVTPTSELKSLMCELKISKSLAEQECFKLKHQLRLSALEKEKYIAVLAVRDRQINEIRTEMSQLQDIVNDQLMELHNSTFQRISSNGNGFGKWNVDQNNRKVGDTADDTLLTINTSDDGFHKHSFKELLSDDNNILQEIPGKNMVQSIKDSKLCHLKSPKYPLLLDRPDSQISMRSMFNDLKKTAYTVTNTPQKSGSHITT